MISMHKFSKIRELKKEGLNASAIARELKINRKTVSKYLASNTPPSYSPRKSSTKLDYFAPFEDQVKDWLDVCSDITSPEIFERLIDLGYEGSERTVFRRVKKLRPVCKERYFEQVYLPGEQCQFDFKETITLPFKEGPVVINLFFGTLPYSGGFHISGSRFKTWEAFGSGMHRFFEKIGGVPKKVRLDNLSPCVKKVLKGGDRIYTDSFDAAIEHYGFEASACRPAKGNDKGDVEREIRSQAGRITRKVKLESKVFDSIDDLNQWLDDFCNARISKSVEQAMKEESLALSVLPEENKAVTGRLLELTASAWGSVLDSKNKSSYSVPNEFIGEKCRVLIESDTVTISCDSVNIGPVIHQRAYLNEDSILLEHALDSLIKKPGAMMRWAHKDILFPNPSFSKFLSWLGGEDSPSARSVFLKCFNLVQHTSSENVGIGMDLIRESESENPLKDLKGLLMAGSRPKHTPYQQKNVRSLDDYDQFMQRKEA